MHPRVKALVERSPTLASGYRDAVAWWRSRRAELRATPHGFSMRGDPAVMSPGFEKEEVDWMLARLDRFDVLVDVGAHHGFYTCLVGTRGKRVVAFEPNQDNLRYLLANVAHNALEGRVQVFPVGLAAEPGVLRLYGRNTGASLRAGWNSQPENDETFVAISTLDRLAGGLDRSTRLLVKIDVEGAELGVLRGAHELLAREVPPMFLVEICLDENQKGINPEFRKTFDMFWDAGFDARTVEHGRRIEPADVDRWIAAGRRDFGSYNVAFVRELL
jgi:FkbM family methyltransferase